ncbi:MAG: CHRD domain-containing protein [Dehalococcoidia bacterium]|nr:CHRD domain-containing protein [Dehalococcoidia bacterium]
MEIDTGVHTMRVRVELSGLTANTTASHIHGPVLVAGGNAGVITPVPSFPGFPAGVTNGTYDHTLPASWNPTFVVNNGGTTASAEVALAAALSTGRAYWNIHTMAFPGGEIRGFLTPPVTGGKNLKITTNSIDLAWDPPRPSRPCPARPQAPPMP